MFAIALFTVRGHKSVAPLSDNTTTAVLSCCARSTVEVESDGEGALASGKFDKFYFIIFFYLRKKNLPVLSMFLVKYLIKISLITGQKLKITSILCHSALIKDSFVYYYRLDMCET